MWSFGSFGVWCCGEKSSGNWDHTGSDQGCSPHSGKEAEAYEEVWVLGSTSKRFQHLRWHIQLETKLGTCELKMMLPAPLGTAPRKRTFLTHACLLVLLVLLSPRPPFLVVQGCDRVSLCSPRCAGLELRSPASASGMLGSKVCATTSCLATLIFNWEIPYMTSMSEAWGHQRPVSFFFLLSFPLLGAG